MSAPANVTPKFPVELSILIEPETRLDRTCRDDRCERLDIHEQGDGCLRGRRTSTRATFGSRTRKFVGEPWRAYARHALRESVLGATSLVEPRSFTSILQYVENDYGSCCRRSIYRQLDTLRDEGAIVRMDFPGRIHAYLRAGSRLVREPDLVLEQILDVYAGYAA